MFRRNALRKFKSMAYAFAQLKKNAFQIHILKVKKRVVNEIKIKR